jgi:tetratricopeptide (TPR) repeat protein
LRAPRRFDESIEAFDASILINNRHRGAFQSKADFYCIDLRRFEESIQAFDCVIEIESSYLDAHANKAFALMQVGGSGFMQCSNGTAIVDERLRHQEMVSNVSQFNSRTIP